MTGLLEIITSRDDYLITLANTASSSILRCLPSSLPESSLEVFLLEFCESMRRKVECHGQLPPPPFVSSVSFPSLPHTSPTIHVSNPQCCCQKKCSCPCHRLGKRGVGRPKQFTDLKHLKRQKNYYNLQFGKGFFAAFQGLLRRYDNESVSYGNMFSQLCNILPNLTSKSRKIFISS